MCSWTCWWFFLAASSSASEKASLSACWEMRDSNSSKAETLQYWPVKLGQYALKWTVGEKIPQIHINYCSTKYRNM